MTYNEFPKTLLVLIIMVLFSPVVTQQVTAQEIHENIKKQTAAINDELISIRRDFHMHPEVSEQEERTAQKIAEYLTELGLEVKTNVGGYSVVGILKGHKSGKKVAWRADIDAMPSKHPDVVDFKSEYEGKRHICGHDVHTTIALGMANVLASQKENIAGTVYFIFQPSEENWKGALSMIDDNLFDIIDPDEIYAAHISPMPAGMIATKPGYLYADYKQVNITFDVETKDEQLISYTKQLISSMQNVAPDSKFWDTRNLMDPTIGLASPNTIFKEYVTAEDQFRVVQKEGKLTVSGFLSASSEELLKSIPAKLEEQIKNGKYASDLVEITYESEIFSYSTDRGNVANNKTLAIETIETISQVYGPTSAIRLYGVIPDGRGDDFAYFQKNTPGVYFLLGGSNFEKGIISMPHSPNFAVDEVCITKGVNSFSSMIVDRLNSSDKL